MACVTIWLSSMAAMAGASHPLELSTSTHAWIRRMAFPTMSSVSCRENDMMCLLRALEMKHKVTYQL